MRSENIDEGLLLEYLLGNLPEAEQVRVEDRAFTDAEYLNALEASESDLIDTYVRGGLSPGDRRAFERQFLTSLNRRRKVEFAKALAKVAAESTLVQRTRPPPDLELDSGLGATSAGCRCSDGFAIGCSSVLARLEERRDAGPHDFSREK